jgi:hypothetical protein
MRVTALIVAAVLAVTVSANPVAEAKWHKQGTLRPFVHVASV